MPSLEERFWSQVIKGKEDECWLWTGPRTGVGYGHLYGEGGFRIVASRFALQLKLGREIPKGKEACHSCDNRLCVNQAHLFEATHRENLHDMVEKRRAHRQHFSVPEVEEMRRMHFRDGLKCSAIAGMVGVPRTVVYNAIMGHTYKVAGGLPWA